MVIMVDNTGEPPPDDPEAPKLGVIDGGKAPKKAAGSRGHRKAADKITREMYDKMVQHYIRGGRSKSSIMRATGVAFATARRAIERGWPERGWVALDILGKRHDAAMDAESVKVTPKNEELQEEALSWQTLRRQQLNVSIFLRSVFLHGLEKMRTMMREANITELKPIRRVVMKKRFDKLGRITEEFPVTVIEDVAVKPNVESVVSMLSNAALFMQRTGAHEISVANSKEPGWMKAPTTGWGALTDEQMDHIAKTGRLPAGVSLAQLEGVVG